MDQISWWALSSLSPVNFSWGLGKAGRTHPSMRSAQYDAVWPERSASGFMKSSDLCPEQLTRLQLKAVLLRKKGAQPTRATQGLSTAAPRLW